MTVTNKLSRYALVIFTLALAACQQDTYTPKPKGYFKIELPAKGYVQYKSEECPFSFEYPEYTRIIRDTMYFGENIEERCWMDIYFPTLGGAIHLSYKEINTQETLEKLVEDAHELSFKHTVKADFIDESLVRTPHNVSGLLYNVGGNAASPTQFFLTDSARHFLRGSLYFQAIPNYDSLKPVITFVNEDILHLVKTLRWNESAK